MGFGWRLRSSATTPLVRAPPWHGRGLVNLEGQRSGERTCSQSSPRNWERAGRIFPIEATIDSVGRIVVPKPLRDALGLSRGRPWTSPVTALGFRSSLRDARPDWSTIPGCSSPPETPRSTTPGSSGSSTPPGVDRAGAGHQRRHPAARTAPPRPSRCRSLVGWPRGRARRPCLAES